MNWSQHGRLQPLLMVSYTSVNLIGVHWSHWCATTCWLACSDMCLSYFQLDSVIYCTLNSVRTQLSQLGFWSVVNLSVYCGLHSVKLDSLIQFEWPLWEFKLLWHSCFQHAHCIPLFHYSFDYTEMLLPLKHHFANFMIICLYSLWDCVFSS